MSLVDRFGDSKEERAQNLAFISSSIALLGFLVALVGLLVNTCRVPTDADARAQVQMTRGDMVVLAATLTTRADQLDQRSASLAATMQSTGTSTNDHLTSVSATLTSRVDGLSDKVDQVEGTAANLDRRVHEIESPAPADDSEGG